MSRGLGTRQRAILARLEAGAEAVVLTSPRDPVARQVAVRRAANRLRDLGLVRLSRERVGARTRLVARLVQAPE